MEIVKTKLKILGVFIAIFALYGAYVNKKQAKEEAEMAAMVAEAETLTEQDVVNMVSHATGQADDDFGIPADMGGASNTDMDDIEGAIAGFNF